MLALFIIIFYVVPVVLLSDLLQMSFRHLRQPNCEEKDIYLYQVILIIFVFFCPFLNLIALYKYISILFDEFEDLHDEVCDLWRKYSIFKFLFIKVK